MTEVAGPSSAEHREIVCAGWLQMKEATSKSKWKVPYHYSNPYSIPPRKLVTDGSNGWFYVFTTVEFPCSSGMHTERLVSDDSLSAPSL